MSSQDAWSNTSTPKESRPPALISSATSYGTMTFEYKQRKTSRLPVAAVNAIRGVVLITTCFGWSCIDQVLGKFIVVKVYYWYTISVQFTEEFYSTDSDERCGHT